MKKRITIVVLALTLGIVGQAQAFQSPRAQPAPSFQPPPAFPPPAFDAPQVLRPEAFRPRALHPQPERACSCLPVDRGAHGGGARVIAR